MVSIQLSVTMEMISTGEFLSSIFRYQQFRREVEHGAKPEVTLFIPFGESPNDGKHRCRLLRAADSGSYEPWLLRATSSTLRGSVS